MISEKKMFSSTNNNNVINPCHHLLSSSSSYLPPPPLPDGVFVNNHDLLSTTLLFPSTSSQYPESLINMALFNNVAAATLSIHDHGGVQVDSFAGAIDSSVPVKKPVKKDRHSKIRTAQGVRDRRVRLSIDIAREFFDLQDMLGFDKASKTLEWLLKKSRNAIKELVNMKHREQLELESATSTKRNNSPDQLAAVSNEIEKTTTVQKPKVHLVAKESRAKARARARERTREKMRSPQLLNQVRNLTQLEVAYRKSDNSYVHNNVASRQVEEFDNQNVARESMMIRRMLNQCTVLGSDQQKDGNNYFPNLFQNWVTNGAMPHSTFCYMTNMNYSTGDELYGEP